MKSNPKERTKLGRYSKVLSPHSRILKLEAGSWKLTELNVIFDDEKSYLV